MSVRRGSSDSDVQFKTKAGLQETGDTDVSGGGGVTVGNLEMFQVSPPPGQDWEIHRIQYQADVRTTDALDTGAAEMDVSFSLPAVTELTFADETVLDAGDDIADSGPGPNSGGTASDGAEEDSDSALVMHYGEMHPGMNQYEAAGAGSAIPPGPIKFRADVKLPEPLLMSDLEELSSLFSTRIKDNGDWEDNTAVNVVGYSSVGIYYKPR